MEEQMVVFQLDNERYAVPISNIREIIVPPNIRPVPNAKEYVLGLINLRGKVITVIDLAQMLGKIAYNSQEMRRIVVLEKEDTLLGIVVDVVNEVINITSNQLEPLPAYSGEGYLTGILHQGDLLLLVLDVEKIFVN